MQFLISNDTLSLRKAMKDLLINAFSNASVFEASSSQETLGLTAKNEVDVILLDVSLPDRNGLDTLKQMRHLGIKVPILMLSTSKDDQHAIKALKAGASGFINKDATNDHLIEAVEMVLKGKRYITPRVNEKLLGDTGRGNRAHEILSEREMYVLRHIASGQSLSDIAKEISLSIDTVSMYRARILEKLSLNNDADLTKYALGKSIM